MDSHSSVPPPVELSASSPVSSPAGEEPWTIKRILTWTTEHLRKHGSESPRLESEILLAHARRCERIQLYANYNEIVDEPTRTLMRTLVKRRVQREPVAYLVGHREFYSLDFFVEPGVFIPRPETETLVTKTLEKIKEIPQPRVLELCTGSGCIPITLAVRRKDLQVVTVEQNPEVKRVAEKNAARHQVQDRVQFLQGDLFAPLTAGQAGDVKYDGTYDVIVSNPPYVCSGEIAGLAADVQAHEPHAALDGGADGLDVIRRILAEAPARLNSQGWCLLEMDPTQIHPVLRLAQNSGHWGASEIYLDLFGRERCLGLQKA